MNEAVEETLRECLGGTQGWGAMGLRADLMQGDESFLVRVALVDEQGLAEGEVSVGADRDLGLHEVRPLTLGSGPTAT